MVTISTNAIEGASYIITVDFTDEDGNAVIPNTATWTLSDSNGTVINSRLNVAITPAASVWFVLTPTDTAITDDLKDKYRYVTIKSTYDSATYGSGLTANEEARFEITPLIKI